MVVNALGISATFEEAIKIVDCVYVSTNKFGEVMGSLRPIIGCKANVPEVNEFCKIIIGNVRKYLICVGRSL